MKVFTTRNSILILTFAVTVVIFSFANQASKVLEKYNPVKTVQQNKSSNRQQSEVAIFPENRPVREVNN